jgi:ATP-dependent DNA ligase
MVLPASPSGFIEPCLPSPAERPPSGPGWVHEIKHDGFPLMAKRDAIGVRLLTRNGHDWSARFPLIGGAVTTLKARSCLIDGEAVACDDDGLSVFERLRRRVEDRHVLLYAFDLLELDGQDLRGEPLEQRKAALAKLLRGNPPGSASTNICRFRARSCSGTPASSGSKASCRSGSDRATPRAARATGSSSRIRRRRR